jgi:hypothetical protein
MLLFLDLSHDEYERKGLLRARGDQSRRALRRGVAASRCS